MDIRIVRFWRCTQDVEMCFGSGKPVTFSVLHPRHTAGPYRFWIRVVPEAFWSTAQSMSMPKCRFNDSQIGRVAVCRELHTATPRPRRRPATSCMDPYRADRPSQDAIRFVSASMAAFR
jgi:hypothetical protein